MNLVEKILKESEYKLFNHGEKPISLQIGYHVCPKSICNKIINEGLKINQPSLSEPEAIFLIRDFYGVIQIAKSLIIGKGIKEDLCVLKINTINLELFEDPSSVKERGVYCQTNIDADNISFLTEIDYSIFKTNKNWKQFWNWWFWNKGIKPEFIQKFKLNQYNK